MVHATEVSQLTESDQHSDTSLTQASALTQPSQSVLLEATTPPSTRRSRFANRPRNIIPADVEIIDIDDLPEHVLFPAPDVQVKQEPAERDVVFVKTEPIESTWRPWIGAGGTGQSPIILDESDDAGPAPAGPIQQVASSSTLSFELMEVDEPSPVIPTINAALPRSGSPESPTSDTASDPSATRAKPKTGNLNFQNKLKQAQLKAAARHRDMRLQPPNVGPPQPVAEASTTSATRGMDLDTPAEQAGAELSSTPLAQNGEHADVDMDDNTETEEDGHGDSDYDSDREFKRQKSKFVLCLLWGSLSTNTFPDMIDARKSSRRRLPARQSQRRKKSSS